jgi:hypothetical protein
MKRLFLKIFLFTPIILLLVLTNYFVDPANLFYSGNKSNDSISYEQTIVNYLREGYNVTNIDNYDERVFQKLFIESLNNSPEIIVLGSSRSQLIESSFFANKRLINNSVTGATIEDLLSIYNIYENKSYKPQKLIIELSPWMLNENNGQTRWELIGDEYNAMINKLALQDNIAMNKKNVHINPKYYELVSFKYFQVSIEKIITNSRSNKSNPFLFDKSEFSNGFYVDSLFIHFSRAGFTYLPLISENKIEFLNRVLKQPDFYIQWNKIYYDFPLLEEVKNLLEETFDYQDKNLENMTDIEKENIIKRNRKLFEATFSEHCPISIEPSTYKTLKMDNTGLTRLNDGTISYPKNFRDRTIEQVNYSAYAYANNSMFGIENFNKISEERVQTLKEFIKYLKKKDIEISFLLVPYHPFVFSVIKSNQIYYNVLVAEQILKMIALENKIKVYGSYNPDVLNINESGFYDGMHIKKEYLKKLLN